MCDHKKSSLRCNVLLMTESSSNYEIANENSVDIRFLNTFKNQLAIDFALAMIDDVRRLMESYEHWLHH